MPYINTRKLKPWETYHQRTAKIKFTATSHFPFDRTAFIRILASVNQNNRYQMARGVNKVILVGNLGASPELRYTGTGTAVCNLRLATNESYKDEGGEWVERTEWHSIVLWGKLAEIANEYLKKGSQAYIEGSLQTRSYEKDGETKYSTEIKARELMLLSGGGDAPSKPVQKAAPKNADPVYAQSDDYAFSPSDDLPF